MFKSIKNGLSLRRIHIWLIVIMGILSGVLLAASFRLTNTYLSLAHAAEERAELDKAAHELMDASDYLTESVQRFTLNGDIRFLEQYFTEAFESNRREEALARMDVDEKTAAALAQLKEAMDHSVNLMDQEYYAMRLVIEAKGYTEYPEILDTVTLSEEDMALSPDEKIRHATELVLNDDYYEQKDNIRRDMQESLDEVDNLMDTVNSEELAVLHSELTFVRIIVVVQILFIIVMMRLTSILGINPIVRAVDRIKEDSPIPEAGAKEFRYLAQAYNKMYMKYQSSMEHLSYKASHDELTGAYNRAGYEHLLSHIDLESTYMILLDVDDFKSVNDNYGHDVGDKILIKLVKVLDGVFRDDDCICRIGGDEFVIFMVHSSGMQRQLIENKIEQIKKGLADKKDGLPPVSVSLGVVNGKDAAGRDNLFEKTDAAMYESKRKGKNTYTFYT